MFFADIVLTIVTLLTIFKFTLVLAIGSMLCIVLIIMSLAYIMQLLEIKSQDLKIFDIIQALLGETIPSLPKKSRDRIILISIIINSVEYYVDSYSQFVDQNMVQDEIVFDSFQEINESHLPLHMNKVEYDVRLANQDHSRMRNMIL